MSTFIAVLRRILGLRPARRVVDKGLQYDRHLIEAIGWWAEQALQIELDAVAEAEALSRSDPLD